MIVPHNSTRIYHVLTDWGSDEVGTSLRVFLAISWCVTTGGALRALLREVVELKAFLAMPKGARLGRRYWSQW